MLIDKTYTPLQADFETVVQGYFEGQYVSHDMRRKLQMVYFAGAASAYGIFANTPENIPTLFDELVDHADKLERDG